LERALLMLSMLVGLMRNGLQSNLNDMMLVYYMCQLNKKK
jgi:hypothetical protein